MPIELTRAQLLISVCIASVFVLFMLSGQSASPASISPWLPRQSAAADSVVDAANSVLPRHRRSPASRRPTPAVCR